MKLIIPISKKDHILGNIEAPVTLVEYGDFQCPYCQDAFPIVENVRKIAGNSLRFVFRHFPLSEIHPLALPAAYASEAAGKQSKFWEMHDLLFKNQSYLEIEDFINFARDLNLKMQQFSKDMQSSKTYTHVHEDFLGGVRSGVNGTPTFFINNVRFDEACTKEGLLKAIAKANKEEDMKNFIMYE